MEFPRMSFLFPRKQSPADRAIVVLEGIQASMEAIKVIFDQLELPWTGPAEVVDDPRIVVLEAMMRDLTVAVAEGVQRVQRSENRVRHIVAGARKELRDAGFEHPGVEAENTELREIDGALSEEKPVPTVPPDVAQAAHSIIPGVSVRQMQLARSRRR